MSSASLRTIIVLVFAFHGVGHVMGIIPALGLVDAAGTGEGWLGSWSSRSWLLTGLLGDTVSRVVCVALYGAGSLGFIAAALALLGWGIPHDAWRALAIVSAAISLVALILYWNALIFFFPHKLGALAVNVATLVALLVMNWPAEVDLALGS